MGKNSKLVLQEAFRPDRCGRCADRSSIPAIECEPEGAGSVSMQSTGLAGQDTIAKEEPMVMNEGQLCGVWLAAWLMSGGHYSLGGFSKVLQEENEG